MLAIYSVLSSAFSEIGENYGCATESQGWRMLCECVHAQVGSAVRLPGLSSPATGHFSEQHLRGWWPKPFATWNERNSNWTGQNLHRFWHLQKTVKHIPQLLENKDACRGKRPKGAHPTKQTEAGLNACCLDWWAEWENNGKKVLRVKKERRKGVFYLGIKGLTQ